MRLRTNLIGNPAVKPAIIAEAKDYTDQQVNNAKQITTDGDALLNLKLQQLIGSAPESYNTLEKLSNGLQALFDVVATEDVDLNTFTELINYITDNRELIEQITSAKIDKSSIYNALDYLTDGKVLDARQGKILADNQAINSAAISLLNTNYAPLVSPDASTARSNILVYPDSTATKKNQASCKWVYQVLRGVGPTKTINAITITIVRNLLTGTFTDGIIVKVISQGKLQQVTIPFSVVSTYNALTVSDTADKFEYTVYLPKNITLVAGEDLFVGWETIAAGDRMSFVTKENATISNDKEYSQGLVKFANSPAGYVSAPSLTYITPPHL